MKKLMKIKSMGFFKDSRLAFILPGILLIILAPAASAQTCATTLTGPLSCVMDTGMAQTRCIKRLVSNQNCPVGAAMAGTKGTTGYYFMVGMGITYLYCQRPSAATGTGFCTVMCDCGILRIDTSEGLPVELLEFGIDSNPVNIEPGLR